MKQLSDQQIELLEELTKRRAPALQPLVTRLRAQPYPAVALSDAEAEALSQIVINEFCEKGLNPDDEPNEYGVQLDYLAGSILMRERETADLPLSSMRQK